MSKLIKVVQKAGFILCVFFASSAISSPPRLAIENLNVDSTLSSREAYVLEQLNWAQLLREAVIDAKFFSVVARDNATIQAMLKEGNLAGSSLARKPAPEEFGVDIASYLLYSTLKRFDIRTSYKSMDMLPGMYDRKDSIHLAFYVRVVDAGGNVVFEELVERSKHYNSGEASEEQKKRNSLRHLASFKAEGRNAVRQVVGAIMAKVNPIVVLDIQAPLIILDRGKNNGFVKGREILIYGKAREVIHPTTGETRRISGGRKGKAKITEVYEDIAEAKLTEGDIGSIQVGNIIRLIKE